MNSFDKIEMAAAVRELATLRSGGAAVGNAIDNTSDSDSALLDWLSENLSKVKLKVEWRALSAKTGEPIVEYTDVRAQIRKAKGNAK
jgi:pilus assembly protein TadC